MQERHPRLRSRGVRDGGEVLSFLWGTRGEHRETALADRHHIGMVPEDRKRVRGDTARRHVHAESGELPRDLVHVGQHQQQTLRCGERGGQRSGLQRTVHGARRSALGLHLDHVGNRAPEVLVS